MRPANWVSDERGYVGESCSTYHLAKAIVTHCGDLMANTS
jgi:hypothetical protein